ncbi:MAG: nucleotide exchange factor GrpE [Vicinamibacterales bacterium]
MPDNRKPFEEFAEDDIRQPLGTDTATGTDDVRPAGEPAAADRTAGEPDAERQRDEYYDLLLRTRAEFDNYRKRVERERQEWAGAAAADLLRDLLPFVDDLERALGADASAGAYRQGVELIHRQLLDLLAKRGVRAIDAVGADFDPHVHQAVMHEHVEGRRDGEVVEELRRGYMLGDRLLRPAMVKVAKV